MIRIPNTPTGPGRDLVKNEADTVIGIYITPSEYLYFQEGDQSTSEWNEYQQSIMPSKTGAEASAVQIARYKEVAENLINEVNALNSLAGLSTDQSVEIEATFDPVYRAIERGYFPLALLRISGLSDTGIAYEGADLRQHWTSMITRYKNEYKITS